MKLFWCPQTRSARALWLLEETGLDYDRVLIDIRDPAKPRDPDFAKASPLGKVPAIADGAVYLADGAAIGIYVADKYPQTKLAPAIDDPTRGQYLFWMLFTPGVIEPAMSEKFTGATPNKLQNGWGDFDTMMSVLEKGVADSEWLLGDTFSAADVMVGSSANFMKMFGALPENKPIEAYIERCLARPAYKRALEIDASGAS